MVDGIEAVLNKCELCCCYDKVVDSYPNKRINEKFSFGVNQLLRAFKCSGHGQRGRELVLVVCHL
jgi:hypothetical protein